MNYDHPYTKMGREFFVSVPIVPPLKGIVIDVPVETNVPLKEGDVLFQINPIPFQQEVDRKRAQFADAEPESGQLLAALNSAQAAVNQAEAEATRTGDNLARAEELNETAGVNSPISVQELESRRQLAAAAVAALDGARARATSADLSYQASVDGLSPTVARLMAELEAAEYDLERTIVRAPSDGIVTQLRLREGVMAANLPRGVQGDVAIYTEHLHHVAIIRKILLRMKSWQNYVFGEGH